MEITSIIGNIAATLTTMSFLPQAVKTIKSKDTGSLSFPMYLMFVMGVLLWLIYGTLNRQMPIIIGNLVTLLLAGIILMFMLRDQLRKKRNQDSGSRI
ncbi:SemiSWEET transporter [Muriicola sp. Z0-33]|uniref:SemiSWEET transporter n=1 Tax=Muriicola sp. Z0-33 TaxID=2816957 RepID=UPI0022380159|nr:SemiSWEET transporter [Muriicola sp. Z0-33]MCW5514926.1 SemiSWEET family sugar transporter [Muriicola sp. Z0-33]